MMKYLKTFNESNQYVTDHEQLRKMLTGTIDYGWGLELPEYSFKIHPDGTVDIEGDVWIGAGFIERWGRDPEGGLPSIPIKFGEVSGRFDIRSGTHVKIKSLQGCPHSCGSFRLVNINVPNLEGGPKHVHGDCDISLCGITSLIGAPEEIGGLFDCSFNPLKSFEGCPKRVGSFEGSRTGVTNLVGSPEFVDGEYTVNEGNLESIEGVPKVCTKLNLRGSGYKSYDPRLLAGVNCEYVILDLEDPIQDLINLFNPDFNWTRYGSLALSKKIEVYKNFKDSLDYNYIRGNVPDLKINLFRLKEALAEFGMNVPEGFDTMASYELINENGEEVNFRGNLLDRGKRGQKLRYFANVMGLSR